jgi:site-specific recombinase XerC
MAWVQKKSGRYYAYFKDQERTPVEKSVPLDTTRKRVAKERLELLVSRYYAGEYDPWTSRSFTPWQTYVTIGAAKEAFLVAKQHLSPRTLDTYEQQLDLWIERVDLPPTMNLQDLRPEDLRPFVWNGSTSTSTKAKRYRHLRVFLNWAEEKGHIKHSPLDDVKQPKAKRKQKAYLSRERGELGKLIKTIREHGETVRDAAGRAPDVAWLIHAIYVAVCTGLRRSAIAHLRWESVDLEQRFIHLRSHENFRPKSGHERSIPLRSHALELLKRLKAERDPAPTDYVIVDRAGKAVRPNRITRRFSFFVEKAGLDSRLTFHRMRDTFASWLSEDGVPMRVIQELAGHSTITMTQQYSHLQPGILGAAMDQTFGSDRPDEGDSEDHKDEPGTDT